MKYVIFPDGTMMSTDDMVIVELNPEQADSLLDDYSDSERYEMACAIGNIGTDALKERT